MTIGSMVGHCSLVPRHALWVCLDIEGSKLGNLNMYAPTDVRARASFWHLVVDNPTHGGLPNFSFWGGGGVGV